MGKKDSGGGGDNSKKAAGNARKAETAASKAAAQRQVEEAAEGTQWDKGAKDKSKAEKEAEKAAEKARKKAELAALKAEDERNTPGPPQPKKAKAAAKKTAQPAPAPSRGTLDLSQLDDEDGSKDVNPQASMDINASGIDNALDALNLAQGTAAEDASKIDRHPERRFKAAYAAFEERRLQEMAEDGSGTGLRLNQRKNQIYKEFEKSAENPFNQVGAAYDATQDELREAAQGAREKVETRLASLTT